LYALNDPIIEASHNITFAPFNVTYHGLAEQIVKAELDPDQNRWELLFDFSKKEGE
jgi:protein XRP2